MYEFIRLIGELQPKVFVMENVPGMVRGKMKGKFKKIMEALKDTKYNVKCKMLNSMHYEVPQSRERLIFIGVKNGEPVYPRPSNKIISVKNAIGRSGYIEYRANYVNKDVSFRISNFNKPCLTITKKNHWNIQPKAFTTKELKTLSSFPQDFIFKGSFDSQWQRIGNAVMPKFMEHIARTIKTEILENNGI